MKNTNNVNALEHKRGWCSERLELGAQSRNEAAQEERKILEINNAAL